MCVRNLRVLTAQAASIDDWLAKSIATIGPVIDPFDTPAHVDYTPPERPPDRPLMAACSCAALESITDE
ncbi:MAG TPA: hypothetical protein PKK06_13530 [Phycisphaerae bacterium]|nr:hypothetical protein [Phycisphaerae bacterium]